MCLILLVNVGVVKKHFLIKKKNYINNLLQYLKIKLIICVVNYVEGLYVIEIEFVFVSLF